MNGFPGLAITLAVFGFKLVRESLRNMLDPKANQAGPARDSWRVSTPSGDISANGSYTISPC